MSIPGLAVLYGGVMQKRWSINSMMLSFAGFSTVLIIWVLYSYKMGFGDSLTGHGTGFFHNFVGTPGSVLSPGQEQGQGIVPTSGTETGLPKSALVYFQFVFAGITPLLMLGSVLGRISFKAWIPFVALWSTLIYTVDAFLLWGGGWLAQQGAIDYSGGYVIHLSAGVSGFVLAAVIGPRLARDREIDAPNNVAMVAVGAGLLWLGWNGFNGGDPYTANSSAGAAILNTNICTAVAFMGWIALDYLTKRKPSLLGGVNGIITGLVAITPAAGYVTGLGAIAIGVIAVVVVYFALNYLSRVPPFRNVDDTLGVIYTHGFAGLAGGVLTGVFANSNMAIGYTEKISHNASDPVCNTAIGKVAANTGHCTYTPHGTPSGLLQGSGHLLLWQCLAALWVIIFSGAGTFVIAKLVNLVVPLRMTEENMEIGDVAEHGHEVYPSDVPSLGYAPTPMPPRAPDTTPARTV
ncbi:MAG: ammonium transporter [Solirubrobacterales bacterium]|nr:ammonium transporter [Solirubrobacterales bacterium]